MHSRITFYVYAKIGQANGGGGDRPPPPGSATAYRVAGIECTCHCGKEEPNYYCGLQCTKELTAQNQQV